MPTIKIECQSLPGETVGTAAKRDSDATGTVTDVAIAAQATASLYFATLTYDDEVSRPLGRWAITIGGVITIATLTTEDDTYTLDPAIGNLPTLTQEEKTQLANTLKSGDVLEFADADPDQTEVHRVTITKIDP